MDDLKNIRDKAQRGIRVFKGNLGLIEIKLKAVEILSCGVLFLDSEGYIIDINKYFCDALGYDKGEILGSLFFDYLCKDDLERTSKAFEVLKDNLELSDFTNRYIKKDGTLVSVHWSKCLMIGDYIVGNVSKFVDYQN